MFKRDINNDTDMSYGELKRYIADKFDCSKRSAANRIKAVSDNGGSLRYCLDNDMFSLEREKLSSFFKSIRFRNYVETISKDSGVKAVKVYKKMKRAKNKFGIPYSDFAKFNLIDASTKALKKRMEIRKERDNKTIYKIAKSKGMTFEEAKDEVERIKKKFSLKLHDYYRKCLYSRTDEEIAELLKKEEEEQKRTLQEISKATGWTEEEISKDMIRVSAKFGITKGDYPMLKCYELDDETLSTYGNLKDSTTLNRNYNDRTSAARLSYKETFDNFYKEFIKRKHWVNRDTSVEKFKEFAEGVDVAFAKPVDGSLGRDVRTVDLKDCDLDELYEELIKLPTLLFEEKVVQHHELSEFYDKSVNTLRLFTILDEKDDFHVFASFIRFGANGSLADNVAAGGVGCGVDPETGVICTPAMNHDGDFIDEHPNSGKRFVGFQIPHWEEALELTENALRKDPGLRYVGWDVAIREDDVVLIEGNSRPDIGICQAFFNYSKIGIKPLYEQYLSYAPEMQDE